MRYVHRIPSIEDAKLVQNWILCNHGEFDDAEHRRGGTDRAQDDCAAACAADLGIYDFDEKCIGNDYTTPPFIAAYVEAFFSGDDWSESWEDTFANLREKTIG